MARKEGGPTERWKNLANGRLGVRLRGEGATTTLEFALTASVILLLVLGMIEFTRAIYTASVVQAAAQEGARAGIVDPAEINQAVTRRMVGLDPDRAIIRSTVLEDSVQVEVIYPYEFITPFITGVVGAEGVQLRGDARMIVY